MEGSLEPPAGLAMVEAAHPSLPPLCVSGQGFTSSQPFQSHPCPPDGGEHLPVTQPSPAAAWQSVLEGAFRMSFCGIEARSCAMSAILQILPWSLQELLSPFPLRGCPAPPVTLCTLALTPLVLPVLCKPL